MGTTNTGEKIRSAADTMRDTVRGTGMTKWRWMTLGSVGAAITLFALGKKNLALMVGMTPATLHALRGH